MRQDKVLFAVIITLWLLSVPSPALTAGKFETDLQRNHADAINASLSRLLDRPSLPSPIASATDLIAAINAANCSAEDDTLDLAAGTTYILTTVDNHTPISDDNGLPIIVDAAVGGKLTIHDHGATIQRSTTANTPQFRFLELASAAT